MLLKKIKTKVEAFGGALAMSLFALTPVWADDTEIFFADAGAKPVWPNVLFIIDTSGSMSNTVYDDDGNSTGMDRLEHVQEGFQTLLTSLSNVNVGLMRFSNPGGPVLFPAYNIDADVDEVGNADVISRISSSDDDAQEVVSSKTMLLDEDYLAMVKITNGVAVSTEYVEESDGDAEEDIDDNSLRTDSIDLDFQGGSVASRKLLGVRFRGLDVPNGATITYAHIGFTARDDDNSDDSPFIIYGEATESGSFATDSGDISRRTLTTQSVPWTLTGAYNDGLQVKTPDLAKLVQEIIDHDDGNTWGAPDAEENDMVFIFKPDESVASAGAREVYTYDGTNTASDRPNLYIEYFVGAEEMTETTLTGLRFQNLDVPRGVTVTNAYIEFTAERPFTGDFNFSVTAEKNGAPAAYTTVAGDISTRTASDISVEWSGNETGEVGDVYRTPDLSALVESVVKEDDWCGGNNMAFMISGDEGFRTGWSHDGEPSLSPRLVVQYDYSTIPDGTSCFRASVSKRIAASSDDVEERGDSISLGGNTLNMEVGNHIGLRFNDLNIPQGSTILSAHIELTEKESQDTVDSAMTISIEDSNNADGYTSDDGTVDERSYLASVDWDIDEDWYQDEVHQTPELKDLLSPIVARGDWQSGNAISFKLDMTGARDRRVYSFDSSPGQAARLVVEYAADGSGGGGRTVRDELLTIVDGLNHNGWTPVQDTLYEASQYYTGAPVLYGAKRGGGPYAYTRVSHEASMVPGTFEIDNPSGCSDTDLSADACKNQTIEDVGGPATYESPINNYCQKTSHIVLLTDGYANKDNSDDEIKTFINNQTCEDAGTGDGGVCVKDLVSYMKDTDLIPNDILKRDQNVITHTIGFNFASDWLKEVAVAGGGRFAEANNANDLVDAINDIIIDMLKIDNTFVAPVAAVNQFNRLNHLSEIYFAVFRPEEYPKWPGNVKKYTLGPGNEVLPKGADPNDPVSAVDPETGFFKDSSTDLWNGTGTPDGKKVELGGAASNLPSHALRNVYTYHSNSVTSSLWAASNRLHTDRIAADGLTKEMFNATGMSDTEFSDLIDWVRGKDVDAAGDVDRFSFGDPLHSRPVAVTYNVSKEDPDVEIFVGTNAGSLQSINSKTGVETFAFFPESTLGIQPSLKENLSTWPHAYGIDGNIVPWIRDNKADGIDASDPLDFVKLFFGMRRGGSNYYSMDVTNRSAPSLDWVIEGGQAPYAEMGQSWATPIPGRIKLKDAEIMDVLFISGGYDESNDDDTLRTEDSIGRAIYIVDANTGLPIWSGGPTDAFTQTFADMKYSIPSTLTVADVDSDGLDDLILVGDTGGQVWRFDINKNLEVEELVSGGVIADLGVADGANTEERNRRFFHSPDVALVKRDGKFELAITIGSGLRPSPLNTVTEDRFYMLNQTAVFGPPAAYVTSTEAELYDTTDNRIGDGVNGLGEEVDIEDEKAALGAKNGWFFEFPRQGEKVLSTPLSFRDTVTFATYTPSSDVTDCEAKVGTSRIYQVQLENGTPVNNWGSVVDEYTENDRAYELETPSIIDEPVVICTGEGCDVFAGAEKPPIDTLTDDRITKTYWRKDN